MPKQKPKTIEDIEFWRFKNCPKDLPGEKVEFKDKDGNPVTSCKGNRTGVGGMSMSYCCFSCSYRVKSTT